MRDVSSVGEVCATLASDAAAWALRCRRRKARRDADAKARPGVGSAGLERRQAKDVGPVSRRRKHDERRARRAARGDARPEADAVLLGRAQDDVVRLAVAAGRVDDALTSDSGPPISTSAGTSRSPMCELTTSVSDVTSSSSARRLTAQIESWPSTSRNGSCGRRRGSGGAETSSPRPQRVHTRDAGWMSAAPAARPQWPQKWTYGLGRRWPWPGRARDVGVRSRGFHSDGGHPAVRCRLQPERPPPAAGHRGCLARGDALRQRIRQNPRRRTRRSARPPRR